MKGCNLKMNRLKKTVANILATAGVILNGNHPWDVQINNEKFYDRVLSQGSLGLGESYVDNWWDCERLDEFFYRILRFDIEKEIKRNWVLFFDALRSKVLNLQSNRRAFQIGEQHYDLSNDLFRDMLDGRMVYSCAYWNGVGSIDEAQEKKLDLICRKLGLEPGMRILDIGCGWGSFAKYAAENYNTEVLGITVSEEQVELGEKICSGLPVEIEFQDYRMVNGKFDRIVSIGMFEHVGYKNYREYMEVAHKCLKDEGLFLLHTIGGNKSVTSADPWINKYIFPNGMLPSIRQIGKAIEGLFVMEDWHNFSADYDKTLMAWYDNFEKTKAYYQEIFYRRWKYYLLSCAGAFSSKKHSIMANRSV